MTDFSNPALQNSAHAVTFVRFWLYRNIRDRCVAYSWYLIMSKCKRRPIRLHFLAAIFRRHSLLYLSFFLFICAGTQGQCLTDYARLYPEPSLDYTLGFGRSISMHENYLAVGIPNSDSLGRITGIVNLYEKKGGTWNLLCSVAPSDPAEGLQFGVNVKLSADYLVVGAAGYGGKAYIFKRPPTGWAAMTEFMALKPLNTAAFGAGPNGGIDISTDQQTIAITDQSYSDGNGAIFVYHKQAAQDWDAPVSPMIINMPEPDAKDFGGGGVVIFEDRILSTSRYTPSGNGGIFIFRDPSGEFLNPVLEAKLTSGSAETTSFLGARNVVVTAEGIFTMSTIGLDTDPKAEILFFEKPASGIWASAEPTCFIDPFLGQTDRITLMTLSTDGDNIYASGANASGNGFLSIVNKGASWCDPVVEVIDTFIPESTQIANYGVVNTCNNTADVAVGFVARPESPMALIALKMLSRNVDNTWSSQLLYSTKRSTAGHYYGSDILGFQDYLFVGAPYDGTYTANGGAVYTYKKNGASWEQKGKITRATETMYDIGFGSALATNGKYLAIGASGFYPNGRVFIYEKTASDWSAVNMVQEIELPDDILTIFAYGDHLAMNDEWLIIPYVQNNPARNMVAFYHFNGTTWDYWQALEIGFGSLIAKTSTLDVAIDGETIVAGEVIIERNSSGMWENRYYLSPSDREVFQMSSDFSTVITNGDLFGYQVEISNNSIFISAPTKDYDGVWDVGAIYVYTKLPWESWSSRTESAKILPRLKDERQIFGYSLKVLGNTLVAGAPGGDFNKDGVTPRNKPGRAYIFQSADYFWQEVTPLLDITGDSFVKDYYGVAIALDESDFIIGASIEDIATGKLSGAVYVTPAPPILTLYPPICSLEEKIDLLGYPFGGTWSGAGIVDASVGIFDPAVVGFGVYELTYKTASCAFDGKISIAVGPPNEAILTTDPEILVCENSPSINVPIGVAPYPNYTYAWYFRDSPDVPFALLDEQQPEMMARDRGEYKVSVSNPQCGSFSPVITIKNEIVEDRSLTPITRTCELNPGGILLSALPSTGTWVGPGVVGETFFPDDLPDGLYDVVYLYTSPLGCTYRDTTAAEIDRLPAHFIGRVSGNLCIEGAVSLSITSSFDPDITYDWQYAAESGAPFGSLSIGEQNASVSERGQYRVAATDGQCSNTSNVVSIDDQNFPVEIMPGEANIKVCPGNPATLSVTDNEKWKYQWYFADAESAPGELLMDGMSSMYTVDEKSGYYFAVVESGVCTVETSRKSVTVFPGDHFFIPNVFTPNGDGLNDDFQVDIQDTEFQILIMNRYGQKMFSSSDPNFLWTGEGASTGTYFWSALYKTCIGEYKREKGTVYLSK